MDRDGDVDLVVFPGWYLRLIFNQGGSQGGQTGEFRVNNVVNAPEKLAQFGSILLGDLNNDGHVDGIVAGCCGRVFTLKPDDDTPNFSWVWINERVSRGRLATRSSILSALDGLAMRAAALGDLDGDGDLDALVGNERGAIVWLNQGGAQDGQDGTFALSGQEISGDQTRAAFLSDLDGDGDLDALVAGRRQAAVWWNDGPATFMRSSQRFRYAKRHGLAIGDFNGDGRPDIFAAEYSKGYRIWFNQGDGTFQRSSGSG